MQKKHATLTQDARTEPNPHDSTPANAPKPVQPKKRGTGRSAAIRKRRHPIRTRRRWNDTGASDPFNAVAHAQPKAGRTVRTSPAAPRPPSAAALRSAKSLRCANAALPAASPLSAPAPKSRAQAGAAARCRHAAAAAAVSEGAACPASQPVPVPTNAAAKTRPSQPAGSLRRKKRG